MVKEAELETTTNKGQIYIIVVTIAVLAAICVSTTCWLAYVGKDVPQALSLLTGGFSGALTTMLTKTTPTQATTSTPAILHPQPPAKVEVVNKPEHPVPTEETKI